MSDTLFDLSRYKSASDDSDRYDWIDATGADPSWNEPAPAIDIDDLATDAAHEWGSCDEFTITLESGQTIDVKFIPCLEGEHRMHQFDFTGPVGPTGFKSQFVLAVVAEEYLHPRDYAQVCVQDLVARFEAAQQQRAKSTKRSRPVAEAQAPQEQGTENDSSTQEPIMAENETTDSSHAKVEVVEELSPEEEADRQRLELKVERAWEEAARALRELRDRRLYRSSHKTFEQYCQDRFGYNRISAHYKIAASEVFENLLTKSEQIMPTKETQVRPLAKLDPDEQRQIWKQAVEAAGGKVPTERIVKDAVLRHKGIVERLKQKHPSPPGFAQGDVVEIKALKRSLLHPFNGMWGTIEHVGSFSYTVWISIAKDVQQCQELEMVKVDDEYTEDIGAMSGRIAALIQFDLEPIEYDILANLQRSRYFTPKQLTLLAFLEQQYGIA